MEDRMKKTFKIVIDILMMLLFVFMMGYHLFGENTHEWMGVVLFGLFFIHQLLNIKWYKGIKKGKYSYQRRLFLIIDLLLLIMMMLTMISGILISKNLFTFINIGGISLMRQLHMLGSSWTYLFMSMHLGLHFIMIKKLFKDKMILKKIAKIVLCILCLYGCYVFFKQEIYLDMFLRIEFKFLPYGENLLIFFIDFVSLIFVGTAIGYKLLFINKKNI